MKKRIFIYMHYMEIGGAERSLIGLLNAFDPSKVEIDLFLNQHGGKLYHLIPEYVNILPSLPEYSAIEKPIATILKEKQIRIAWLRLKAKICHFIHTYKSPPPKELVDESIFQYVYCNVSPALRSLNYLGEYDLAISYLHPHNIVRDKIKAKKKICWIHTDYSSVYVNTKLEYPVWDAYDNIVSLSNICSQRFLEKFPQLKHKIIEMPNILSSKVIRKLAKSETTSSISNSPGAIKLLTIGRACKAKRLDSIPEICHELRKRNVSLQWFILAIGDTTQIRRKIALYNLEDTIILLSPRANHYPILSQCDIYVQPSLYEGYCTAVNEAKILKRPVIVSHYPTACSQIQDGVDGKIAPLPIHDFTEALYQFIVSPQLRINIHKYLATHDFGNEAEIKKIYDLI